MAAHHPHVLRAVVALAGVAWASGVAGATSTLVGKYCGALDSGGHMVPAETDIFSDGTGGLTGTYHFEDDGKTYDGLLLGGTLIGSGEWLLRWRDSFGVGTLDIHFNADASVFDGHWGAGREKPVFNWNGKLCEGPATS